jgi:hypothetical protein
VTWSSGRPDPPAFGVGGGGSSGDHDRALDGRGDSVRERPSNKEFGGEGLEGRTGIEVGEESVEGRWPRWWPSRPTRAVARAGVVVGEDNSFLFSCSHTE